MKLLLFEIGGFIMIHVALTGHRPNKLGGYNINTPQYEAFKNDLKRHIQFLLETHDFVIGHTGLALGADTIWGLALVDAKNYYGDRVKIHSELPFLGQSSAWHNKTDRDTWDLIRANSDYETNYAPELSANVEDKRVVAKAMNDRNIGMIDHADQLLALWDGTKGGTGNAVKYAQGIAKPVVYIDPRKYFQH